MRSSRVVRGVCACLLVGWLGVGLALAGLLMELASSDGLLRYPQAARLGQPDFVAEAWAAGRLGHRALYHTPDAWRRVLSWYARRYAFELDRKPELKGGCFHTTTTEAWLRLQHTFRLTLCSGTAGTTILVERSLGLMGIR
jgi:hypothetical protein